MQPSDRLDVLLLDYEMAREDERALLSAQVTLLAAAITLLSILAAVVTQTCQFQPKTPSSTCTEVPDAVVALAPVGPVALLAYVAMLGTVATIRSYYLRIVEAELRIHAGEPMT